MQTVVLAAGEGTRMRPLTGSRPKPMLPVARKPLLSYPLDAAVAAGASRFIVVVGYRANQIREYYGDAYRGVPIKYARQDSQEGTAHAVQTARPFLTDEPFAVLAGDNLYDANAMTQLFDAVPAIGAAEVTDPRSYGVFEIDGDRVTGIIEKPEDPPSSLVNVSAYVFSPAALEWLDVGLSERQEYELTDVLAKQLDTGEVHVIEFSRWLDVGRPWELLEANELILDDLDRAIDGEVHETAEIIDDVVIEAGARVRSGVVIEGPSVVAAGSSIGPNAYIRGATVVRPNAHVGHAVEVKNSIIMEGASASHLSYIGDSIIGPAVNLGAGTIVANLRHDDEPVRVTIKGDRVSTDRRKFGVVLGDNVKTGINTSLNAGVTLSENTSTTPGETVTRDR